ncbi:MAG TPA: 3-phosphoglycerate kinase [Thiopseudomonas sp.]|nr:3-phosphoglycerate kinase [Thiopseudomonas sp.]
MKRISAMLVLLLPSLALAFPFEVEQQLNGAEVDVQTMDLGNNMAAVSLQNYGQRTAVCKVRFRSGPEAPRTRKAKVKSGESAHVTARFNSTVIRMRVRVECQLD